MPVAKMPGDKMPVKIPGEDKMLAILWDREDKMSILSKHLIYHTDGQVNWILTYWWSSKLNINLSFKSSFTVPKSFYVS